MDSNSPSDNPYKSAAESAVQSAELPDSRALPPNELSSETAANLSLTSRLMKIAAVVFVFASLVPVVQLIAGFRMYGFPKGWTWWHTTVVYRTIYCPCWLLLAWTLWKYAGCLGGMSRDGMYHFEDSTKRQAKFWLAVALMLFVVLAGVVGSAGFFLSRGPLQ